MSLSFKDSLANNMENNIATVSQEITNENSEGIETASVMAYSMRSMAPFSDDGWTAINDKGYRFYDDEYKDEGYSTVDELKNITLDSKQFNITQERNSQYIPFKMPRYYDGFDLATTELSIYYVNKNKDSHTDIPVDVYCNDEYIRFAWLVSEFATKEAGILQFEIHAKGTNSKGEEYTWKSKSIDKLNVLQSLENVAEGEIGLSEEEVEGWYNKIQLESHDAKIAAENAQASAEQAATLVASLQDGIADEVKTAVDNAVNDVVDTKIDNKLENYYTIVDTYNRTEIETLIESVKPDGYATIEYVDEQIGDIGDSENVVGYVDSQIDTLSQKFGNLVDDENNPLTVEAYVNKKVEEVNVSEQIAEQIGELGDDDEGNPIETVVDYVNKKVDKVDVSEQLGDLGTNEDGAAKTVKQYVDDAVADVDVDLTGYATETYVNDKVDPLSSSVSTNTNNISSLSTTIGELQADVGAIDTSPRLTYDVEYNDVENPDVGENVFVLYEITNEGKESEIKEAKKKFTIVGGTGVGSSSVLKISYVTTSPVMATINDKVLITYNFSGTDSSGDIVPEGNYTWKIGNKTIASGIATNGENTFDATDFASTTSQKFTLNITDDAGSLVTKSWTVQKVDVRLESTFSDAYSKNGEVSFNYTPYGAIEKKIHFILDGTELGVVTTSASGIPTSYPIPAQTHGSHLLEVYMTAEINGKTIGLEEIIDENGEVVGYNHTIKIIKDILWQDPTSTIPIIGCATPTINMMQYDTVNIKYAVLDPNTETPKVTWSINDEVVSEETLTEKDEYGYYTYPYKANEAGTFALTISCGEAEPKVITVNVEKLNINVSPVTAGLEFDFNPVGYSNNSADRLWSHNNVTMDVSPDFDWVNGGYQIDENGDQYFCIKAGTYAVINYNLFADDPKKTGKEFKVVFRTKNIKRRNTSFLTCLNENIGIDMKVEHATIYNSGGSLRSDYCEDTIIEYEFNINKDTDMMIVMSYEDGAPSKPCEYVSTTSFKQSSPQPITIGSEDCDIHIYRMKAYSNSLTDTDIKNNFIADARNADEIIARYNRNQIYNTDGKIISTSASGDFSVDALMKAAPDLRYIFLEVPQFTNDKDNKIDGCTVHFRYPSGTRPQDNWTCTGVRHRGQGTSSNLYGYAGRNIDLCMDRDESLFTWVDEEGNTVESSTITLTDTSVPTDYLNIKVNIASSENANNAQFARRFNEYQPFLRYARKKDSKVKDTMEFYNCVVFIRETSTDLSKEPHREFNDTDWHFYAIGNIGDSKKTDDTRVNNANDPKEHIIEITDADKPLSAFPTGKEANAVCPVGEWRDGNGAYDILHSAEYVYDEEGAFESFGGTTYEFRYEMDDITKEQREENINAWRDLYKFIVTSTDKEFYANLKNYFVVDSALYFYLFTERYTMVDNRAKNSFWHYGKVYISTDEADRLGETEASYYIIDNAAAAINDGYRYDLTFAYDMDTSLGIDNTGDYVFSYGKEDTDYYDGSASKEVFRVSNSTFFCRLRDLFPSEMQAMFKDREEKNAWNSTSLIDQWDNSQAQFPEELWRLDYERKYYRPYLALSIDNSIVPVDEKGDKKVDKTFLIGKFFGRKKYARRAFETNQEVYFATKYFGNKVLSDVFWIRGNVYDGDDKNLKQNYSLKLTPYSDMYLCMQYTSTGTPIHSMENGKPKRIRAGESYTFENNAESMDFIYVYAAGWIQEVGDLSRCYFDDNNFSSATRLQKLIIGSTDDGYENTFMKEVLVDSNPLLEYLDLRNVSGINSVINLSGCSNLKELYAEGTNTTGAIFANGGLLQTAHLPNTIKSLSMKNLNYITDFAVDDDDYANLQALTVENVPNINTYEIVADAPSLRSLRLINLNWDDTYQIQDTSIFDRLLTVGGIDSSGHEINLSVLTGIASVSTAGQYDLDDYKKAWSELTITPRDGIIPQFKVTFKNYDGTTLLRADGKPEIQYINQYGNAIDPLTRVENPVTTPTKESSIQYSYEFSGWDKEFTNVVMDIDVYATYTEELRDYTIQYVLPSSMGGTILKTASGKYGDNIVYDGIIPTYTKAEPTVFYLFNRWDKSGFLTGDFDENGVKTVTAMFNDFRGNSTYFKDKQLAQLTPVEIYAMNKLGMAENVIKEDNEAGKNSYTIVTGNDINYDDIESQLIIDNKQCVLEGENYGKSAVFTGSTYIDTKIQLFKDEDDDGHPDKDFVLAIDYEFLTGCESGRILAQCYQSNLDQGFNLTYNGGNAQFVWGTSSHNIFSNSISAINKREMVIIRHKKDDNNLTIYKSNLDGDSVLVHTLPKQQATIINSTLIFGADEYYDNKAVGSINWAKIWYKDLGEKACKDLAMWVHESITLEACGFNRYFVMDDLNNVTDQKCSFSLLASHLLSRIRKWNLTNTNVGGWANSELNKSLNTRLYSAIPMQIRSLLKRMAVRSSVGGGSSSVPSENISTSGCYITIPALVELDSTYNIGYNGNAIKAYDDEIRAVTGKAKTISYMSTNDARKRAFDGGDYYDYWTRSPSISHSNYIWRIGDGKLTPSTSGTDTLGAPSQITQANSDLGVLIEISF